MPCYEYDNTVKYMSRYITAIDSGFACMYSQMGPSSCLIEMKVRSNDCLNHKLVASENLAELECLTTK